MAITRRAVLKGAIAASTGALAGVGAYGFAYDDNNNQRTTIATEPLLDSVVFPVHRMHSASKRRPEGNAWAK